ncbi:MAG: DUF2231 domain-containing protein [Melioribacteraceae bacterium]
MKIFAELHPLIIHFPIVLLFSFVGLEILNLFLKKKYLITISHVLLFIAVITSLAATLTGNLAMQEVIDKITNKDIIEAIEKHEEFASLTLWYFFTLLIIKTYLVLKKKFAHKLQYLFVIFALVGLYLIFTAAKLGGVLVYKFGVGTELFN